MPMLSTEQIREDEDRFQLKTYAKMPLAVERGRGCWVYDADGTRYLDFYGGHAVVSTGHCHPRVVEALRRQAGDLIFYSNVAYNGVRSRACRVLIESAGSPYHQVFLTNSGGEANENAIKLARAVTGRTEFLSMRGAFHGRSYGSLTATGIEKYSRYLNTPVPDHVVLNPEETPGRISRKTAGVLVEPIQSMAGVREIPQTLLAEIASACRQEGALLIFDEVQTGIGRTGRFLFAGTGGVFPDMVTLAKGLASGVPVGALLVTEEVASKVSSGDLGTTFGGGPLACAAMEATLFIVRNEALVDNAARIGDYLKQELARLEQVEEVRGRGLLLGIRFRERPAREVQSHLFDGKILSGTSDDPAILRLMPPLTIKREEADRLLEELRKL